MKKVTVLVAVYKAAQHVPSKTQSLLNQTIFTECDVVLLNCQDLEGESDLFKPLRTANKNVTELIYGDYVKLYKSWNDGIRITDSEYVVNFNMDDAWHPDYLASCVAFLDRNQDFSVVSSQVLVTDECNQVWPKWSWVDRMPVYAYPGSTAGPCPVWRRSLHHKYGYYDDYYVIGDARLWEKWYAGGEQFGLINEDLVLYYRNPHSLERRSNGNVSLRDLDLHGG